MSGVEPAGGVLWTAGPAIDLLDRGFCYGDGVFETLRYFSNDAIPERSGFWLLDRHLDRLLRGLSALQLDWPDRAEIRELLRAAAAAADRAGIDCVLRLFVSAAPTARGYRRPPHHPVLLRAQLSAAPPWSSLPAAPLLACIAPTPLPSAVPASGFKHMNRLGEVLSNVSAADDVAAAETLLPDKQGNLVCASTSNLLFPTAEGFATPKISSSGIAGTARSALLACADLKLVEAVVTAKQAAAAPCFWSINSVVGLKALTLKEQFAETALSSFLTIAQDRLLQALDNSRLEHCQGPDDERFVQQLDNLGTLAHRDDLRGSF